MNMPDFSRPVLAIDTATSVLSLALSAHGKLYCRDIAAANAQSALVLPQIGELLAEAQLSSADLAAVVYAQGPGAFTGLRIGIGVAQGLAVPFAVPLIGVPTLDAVAYSVAGECVLAATDARMGEVFYAWFDTVSHRRLSDYCVGSAAEIVRPSGVDANARVQAVGNAFALDNPPAFEGVASMPSAADYLRLAQSGRYPAMSAEYAELLYVRNKVALTAAEQAARRSTAV